jgi:phosphomannomutase|uniref:phospho-sugar mutase n=1 Tax=Candidatus Planktophila sp. TaxID=2175601 RepID=UPI00404B8773
MDSKLLAEVRAWIEDDPDPQTAAQLTALLDAEDEVALRKYFAGFLEFGTAGLRGPLGPGPSCMNQAVVGKTAAGIVAYMKERSLTSVVIGRDARHGSEVFENISAEIFSGAGFKVSVLPRPLPTPVLAFAVNELGADIGVMVTASHNPRSDNGYKVYLGGTVDGVTYRGSQIISPADKQISAHIQSIESLKSMPRGSGWQILDEDIVEKYVERTKVLAPRPAELKIVYTAMHGVGTKTLQRVFHRAGFPSLILVQSQAQPDPDFPTLPFPNPEETGALDLALESAKAFDADLVIANDPDADRCSVAIKERDTTWRALRGDEIGAILGEVIAKNAQSGTLANSIVSSSILSKIAAHHQLNFEETLTGFKYIAKIPNLIFGYEEAIGFCVDPQTVNDKDGVSAALLMAQIATDLKREGKTLNDLLNEIWKTYGFHATEQISIRVSDLVLITTLMKKLRTQTITEIAGFKVLSKDDLAKPTNSLPATDGLRFNLEKKIRIIIRPSGTEPKIKCYIEVVNSDKSVALSLLEQLRPSLRELLS